MSAKLTPQQIVDELLRENTRWGNRDKENQIVAAFDAGTIAGRQQAVKLIHANLIDKRNNPEIPDSSNGGGR